METPIRRTLSLTAGLLAIAVSLGAAADNPTPFPGTNIIESTHPYATMVDKLHEAVAKNKMGVVAKASATVGAKKIGVTIPGNMVVMVFHPRFAVRMLDASVPAGIEAPLRFYITENADGTTTLTYRDPSSVFAPYENADLDTMAKELDDIFARIAADAIS